MRTTELFVEQVLIGLAVLFTVGLLVNQLAVKAFLTSGLGELALVLGGAYLIGIVYDRLADTLLGDLEQHQRLLFALRHLDDEPAPSDPFPEDRYRMEVLDSPEASAHAQYLRSRMRLTRSLATVLPALTVAAASSLQPPYGRVRTAAALITAALYGAALIQVVRRRRLPRTWELRDLDVRRRYAVLVGSGDGDLPWRRGAAVAFLKGGIGWFGVPVLLVAAAVALAAGAPLMALGIPAAGGCLTAVTGWAWWRITSTFHGFVRAFHLHGGRKVPAA